MDIKITCPRCRALRMAGLGFALALAFCAHDLPHVGGPEPASLPTAQGITQVGSGGAGPLRPGPGRLVLEGYAPIVTVSGPSVSQLGSRWPT